MLVLSRKKQESIIIGQASSLEQMVRVTVLELSGCRVALGFECSDEVPIHRDEVWERIVRDESRRTQPDARSPTLSFHHGCQAEGIQSSVKRQPCV